MLRVKRAINYLMHDRKHFLDSCIVKIGFLLPDKLYLTLRYRLIMGKWIDWKHPKTFTEKIQWLKIYDFKPEYTQLVDKFAVKEYVAARLGRQYIIPTLAVWNSVNEINWDGLPQQFVLKTTQGGGGVGIVICKDKDNFDKDLAISKLKRSMKFNAGYSFREKPYKAVPKKIIAEKFISTDAGSGLKDYKFFCFNGVVKFFKIDFGRFIDHHANYYSTQGELLPYGEKGIEPIYNHLEIIPENLDEMIKIAEQLSSGFRFLRVDLYNVSGKIYFGELTFYPASGLLPFTNEESDEKIGSYLPL